MGGWANIRLELHWSRAICLSLWWGLHQYIFNSTSIWSWAHVVYMLHGYWPIVFLICQPMLTIIWECGDCGSWANLCLLSNIIWGWNWSGRYVYMGQYLFNVMGTGPIYFTYYTEGWPLYLEYHIGTGPDMCNTLSMIYASCTNALINIMRQLG